MPATMNLRENKTAQWKRYRLCGLLLVLMNVRPGRGVGNFGDPQNRGFEYAGLLIYVMAAYTFTITAMAVVNLVRYRKYHSPVMSAARVLNLVTALVSMLSLETAMLTQFGGNDSPLFRRTMLATTGGAVCVLVVAVGAFMIIRSTRQLKRLGQNHWKPHRILWRNDEFLPERRSISEGEILNGRSERNF